MLNDNQTLIHPYNEVLSNGKERAVDSHNNMNFGIKKRPDSKGYKLYNSTLYMTF